MLRKLSSLCVALAALAATSIAAAAQDRFALVIGNSQYKNVTPLANPGRDAQAMAALLKDAGFEVTAALDLDKTSMSRAIRFFTNQIAGKPENTVALIYYAGHGMQVDGENFLIPVDATIGREADVALEAMRFADVMSMFETVRSKTRIVMLDACRDNPFADVAKTAPRGLALVNAPAGTLVAYSTSPGNTASDGGGQNSPFTLALTKGAREPGTPIESLLKSVRLSVHGASGGQQTPWEVSSLVEPFSFFPGSAPKADTSRGKNAETWRKELQALSPRDAYAIAVREDDVVVYEQYLALYASDALAPGLRSILDRRMMMVAWLEAVTLNTASGYAAFIARFPDSDITATARRLEERAKARSSFARSISPILGLSANALGAQPTQPEVRTIVREVRVPSPPEIRTVVKEVPREVIKVVHVPGPVRACNCGGPRSIPVRVHSAPPPRIHGGPPPRIHSAPPIRINIGTRLGNPGGIHRPSGHRPPQHGGHRPPSGGHRGGFGGGIGIRF